MLRILPTAILSLLIALDSPAAAQDKWLNLKSFTVWSPVDDRDTRTLIWQLEQIRSAMVAVWPWAPR